MVRKVLLLLLISTSSFAQITGNVVDAKTSKPLFFASVSLIKLM